MNYRYIDDQNFEDLASGRVIYHRSGLPNFPVRLAGEIFMTCLELCGQPKAVLYDPCCGGAYLLTALGFLCGEHIASIYASDISDEARSLAQENLNLLTPQGLERRRAQLQAIHNELGKNSHLDALESVARLNERISRHPQINSTIFPANIMDATALHNAPFKADIVFADVPYGNLASWSEHDISAIDKLLDAIIPVLNDDSVVAISSDKSQKITNLRYRRVRKILVGKRKIELLRKE